jgi:hypothetical protein
LAKPQSQSDRIITDMKLFLIAVFTIISTAAFADPPPDQRMVVGTHPIISDSVKNDDYPND